MKTPFWRWVFWFFLLFCIDFLVPFTLLAERPTLAGSFLFWVVWTLVAMISMLIITAGWQDQNHQI